MAGKLKKTNIESDVSQTEIEIKDGKISVPGFKYKKNGEKKETTYKACQLDLPDRPGEIVRIYLYKTGAISTKDGGDHELILGEFEMPLPEYEQVDVEEDGEKAGEQKQQLKKLDFANIKPVTNKVPTRS